MTPTGPTRAPEPHQREDEREALARREGEKFAQSHYPRPNPKHDAAAVGYVVGHSDGWDAALAWFAARQPARVEAVAKVLAEHQPYRSGGVFRCKAGGCTWSSVDETWAGAYRHQAAQIAALAPEPVPGVSAEQVEAATATYVKCRRGATGKVNNWDRAAMLDALAALGIEVKP